MERGIEPAPSRSEAVLSWLPLITGALASYGPVGWNYGFALYFLTWRHGFVKRGLVGEMFSPLSHLSRGNLLGIEYGFLAIGFALTYAVWKPMLFGTAGERRLAAVVLCGPAALPHLGYLFAQPDITLYILLLLGLWVLLRWRAEVAAIASLPLCVLGLLGHEAFSLMFYPLVVAILLDLCRKGKLRLSSVILHVCVMTVALLAVLHWGTLKVPLATVLREAESRTTVPIQPQVYEVMGSSLAQQQALVRKLYTPGVLWTAWLTVALSAPYFYLLTGLLERAFRAARMPRWQRALSAVLLIAPLPLCTLGHDTTRWIGAMCLDASLLVLYLCQSDEREGPVRQCLAKWAAEPAAMVWLAYLIAIGPYGATGIRTAEQFVQAWTGY